VKYKKGVVKMDKEYFKAGKERVENESGLLW